MADHRETEHTARVNLCNKFAKLIDVKSIVTLALTGAMVAILFNDTQISQEALALFCTSYGAIITYFFTRKDGEKE